VFKKSEIFFNCLISPWRFCATSSAFSNLLLVLEANISLVLFDKVNGKFVKLLEIVRRGCHLCRCITKPSNILFNMIDEFMILLAWICVIKSQIASTSIFLGNCEIKTNSFCVSNMKISIRFWRESCSYLSSCFFFVSFKMFFLVCT